MPEASNPETSKIRVLIADDHPLFRDGMHGLLDSVEKTEVVGEAENGEEAVRKAAELRPDVILMDLNMPGMNGIAATREVLARNPGVGILVVTMLEDDDSVFAAMRAGALGYLLKGASQEEVLRAINAVANGEAIFGPGIASRVMGLFSTPRPAAQAFPELTGREEEILARIARGDNNAEIAGDLFLSLKTVQNHVSNIMRKLQVADRTQAAIRAREAGLGED
jgi:DNA-binding NarL/FixJ family response regulator